MATERTVRSQVGGGMIVAGLVLAIPGAVAILQGAAAGLLLLVIPAALVFGGLRMKKRANN